MAATVLICRPAASQDGLQLKITAPKTEFYLGELIPLELHFTSTRPRAYIADSRTSDRVGRLNGMEEFVVEPTSLTEDPLRGLPGENSGMGGLSGGPVLLSAEPFQVERILNQWVRFRHPGEYRVHVISRRVRAVENPDRSDYQLRMDHRGKTVEVVSNVLTLKIRPASQPWVQDQIAAAKKILEAQPPHSYQNELERDRAIQVLRFLESQDAAEELVRQLTDGHDQGSHSAYMGVLGSPYRTQLLPLMEQRLEAAGQPVWDRYLHTLAHLAELTESGGPMPKYPAEADARSAWDAEFRRRATVLKLKRNLYATRLIDSLSSKQPQARAVSLNTLLNLATPNRPEPSWMKGVKESLISEFRNLPPMTQNILLEYRWSTWKGPAILPLLRDLLTNPPAQGFETTQAIVLRRLYELSPEEGREMILQEIRQPEKNIPFATLAMLADASLPELNDALAERFDALLILRYATGDIVERVRSKYLEHAAEVQKQNLPGCAGPLVFYFLKYDPPFGERLLLEDFIRSRAFPACYDIGFQFLELGRWAYSPTLERIAIESLESTKVAIRRGAVDVLGRYGSKSALQPLWETMERFRSWWKGREEELKEKTGEESLQLERALQWALAHADAWTLQEPELRRLLHLCSSDWCRSEVSHCIEMAKAPVQIQVSPDSGEGFRYQVGQYGPDDEASLRRRLAQYSDGTPFRMLHLSNESDFPGMREARERAEAIVRASGRQLAQ